MHVAFETGEVMNLQSLDLLGDPGEGGHQHRDTDQRAQFGGNAVAQFERRHEGRADAAHHRGVDQSDGGIERRDRAERGQQEQPCTAGCP